MPSVLPRRLPGFRFETVPPPRADILPRMDIAAFVGFATAGPVHQPVVLEDPSRFEGIFGPDLALAEDPRDGVIRRAHLGPAVRAFFRNGGRRCWVIRVAGDHAHTLAFPLPGLLALEGDTLRPAFARARSPGTALDACRVSTALTRSSVLFAELRLEAACLALTPAAARELNAGDLLRFRFEAEGLSVFAAVHPPGPDAPAPAEWALTSVSWFLDRARHLPIAHAGTAQSEDGPGSSRTFAAALVPLAASVEPAAAGSTEALQAEVDLAISPAEAPSPGAWLRLDFGEDTLWLRVTDVLPGPAAASPPERSTRVRGPAWWWLRAGPVNPPVSRPAAERLFLELRAHRGATLQRLEALAFHPRHPRYWQALPPDAAFYREADWNESARAAGAEAQAALWREAGDPRFPLAGGDGGGATFLPLAIGALPTDALPPAPTAADALVREGLDEFGAALFLDPDLVESGLESLLGEADFIQYQKLTPGGRAGRRLRGVHAALGVEEVTLIAVPDAAHPGWEPGAFAEVPPPAPSAPFERPQWWTSLPCQPRREVPAAAEPPWGSFLACGLRVIAPPQLALAGEPGAAGDLGLRLTAAEPDAGEFVVEESGRPDFAGAVEVYRGESENVTLPGRGLGTRYFRARRVVAGETSDWSAGLAVPVRGVPRWVLRVPEDAEATALLCVQRALLRLCAARGDLLAVLSLPRHFREAETLAHLAALQSGTGPALPVGAALSLPLTAGEAAAFGFGAVYHPWLVEREDRGGHVAVPPDGNVLGVYARRSLKRGAWVAPANEPLHGVVALTPPLEDRPPYRLRTAPLNLLRQEPHGFVCLEAITLSAQPDAQPVNVRRLLALLRRLALRHGVDYVFEPNDDAFRRRVQHGFEALLNLLYVRGAFAGATPEAAYQVNTGPTVNPPQSVEQGRFLVELKVAPALPLTFVTVRLVQTNERAFVTESA